MAIEQPEDDRSGPPPGGGAGGRSDVGWDSMREFDVGDLDTVIHGRIRLGVMAALANLETATFNELKEALGATQGNLSVHLRKLEEAGYIQTERRLKGKKTETKAWLTPAGHRAFGRYLKAMEALIRTSEG